MLKSGRKRKFAGFSDINLEAKKLCLLQCFVGEGIKDSLIRKFINSFDEITKNGEEKSQNARALKYFVQMTMNKIYENNNKTKNVNFKIRNIVSNPTMLTGRQKAIQAHVTNSLKFRGFCVIDKYMGDEFGCLLSNEAEWLYKQGRFQNGSVVGANVSNTAHRSDQVYWAGENEYESKNVKKLLRFTDGIVTDGTGVTENISKSSATKAMVSIYPGNNCGHNMHVDNAVKDGRRLTCTYFMNPLWNAEKEGGSLKLLARTCGKVAKIEPIMDRMLFFYSDYRNPHEVQPCNKTRKSVAFWYFDKNEREAVMVKK